MGSDAHVIVVGERPDDLLDHAHARVEQLEARWSRFRASSDICRLNASGGRPLAVSWETALLVRRAIDAWRATGGGFDPTVLPAVIAAGYDRDFVEIGRTAGPSGGRGPAGGEAAIGAPTDIVVDGHTVQLPAGTTFDPGGIGKGLAADLVATELLEHGASAVCVNLGGDVRAIGDHTAPGNASWPRQRSWLIDIEAPRHPAALAQVRTTDGAVATSTTLLRRWVHEFGEAHHLIDPGTSRPSTSDVVLVAVSAGEAWEAETLAKACLLRGATRVFDLIRPTQWALALTADGRVLTTAQEAP